MTAIPRAVLAAVGAAALAACARSVPPVAVQPPAPAAADRTGCDALAAALPGSLGPKLGARVVQPASPYTRAWGRPAVVLRCGVGYPPGYLPTSTVDDVNGVSWFATQGQDDVVFTTVTRRPRAAVAVPRSYGQAFDVLIALGPAVQQATRATTR